MASTTELVNRADVTYLTRRWEAASPRAVALITHGLGEHSGRYEHIGDRFAAAGIETFAFDQWGHGDRSGPRMYVEVFDHFLDDVEHHIAELRGRAVPLILFGHSMGGLIAFTYAVSERPAPDLLILSSPALDAKIAAWQKFLAKTLTRVLPRAKAPTGIKGHQLSSNPLIGEAYFADPLVQTQSSTRLAAEMMNAMDWARERHHELDVPTLVTHGGADDIVPAEYSAPLAELPTVERILYPDHRHEPFNEPTGTDVLDDMVAWVDRQLA